MSCYELSRLVPVEANPNSSRPKLGLASLRRNPAAPCGLDHVHVRAGDDKIELADQAGLEVSPEARSIEGRALNFEILVSDVQFPNLPKKTTKPARDPMLFVTIDGAVSDFPTSWTSATDRAAALNRWCAIIATEVMRSFPAGSADRPAAKKFVWSHRLSVANEQIVRRDVVAELVRLYNESLSVT